MGEEYLLIIHKAFLSPHEETQKQNEVPI